MWHWTCGLGGGQGPYSEKVCGEERGECCHDCNILLTFLNKKVGVLKKKNNATLVFVVLRERDIIKATLSEVFLLF